MTSTKERQQRAAARARLAREMAERQETARRRRQRQAAIGAAGALVLIVGGVAWGIAALSGDSQPQATPDPSPAPTHEGLCDWQSEDAAGNPYLMDAGTPPVVEQAPSAPQTMTLTTNHGAITVEVDSPNAPCTAASFTHLAAQEFYDGTPCHRLVTEDIYVLQCGDPSGTGMGGATYRYAEENLPGTESPNYPKGTVAMANTGQPASTGSQFFIVYQDTDLPPNYTVLGTVTEGIEVVEEIAADGAVNPDGEAVMDGAPKTETSIESLRITDPAA